MESMSCIASGVDARSEVCLSAMEGLSPLPVTESLHLEKIALVSSLFDMIALSVVLDAICLSHREPFFED